MSIHSKTKRQALSQLFLLLAILVVLNILGNQWFTRFDLTSEKRFSLTQPTRDLLSQLNDDVYIQVYLDGEFPAGFKRLRNATAEMLNEFKAYTGNKLQYEFIDPLADATKEQKEKIAQQLMDKGLEPTRLIENKEGYSEKIIFPGAIVTYRGHEMPVQLLLQQTDKSNAEGTLNNSIMLLEYDFANAIAKLHNDHKPAVAFIEGNGELTGAPINDMVYTLSKYFKVDRFDLKNNYCIPNNRYDAIVIAKPTEKIDEPQKFKIDQFIMNGGKALWLVENMRAEMDSLKRGSFLALDYGLNLEDQLFKYGVRVNMNMVKDLQCEKIPIVVGTDRLGNAQQMQPFPWIYFPVITNVNNNHPLTKNMGPILFRFGGSIDTIPSKDNSIKKTILLSTSKYSQSVSTPIRIDVGEVRTPPDPAQFNLPEQTVAVALEGEFPSVFKNRLSAQTLAMVDTAQGCNGFVEKSKPTRMVVVAEGDVIRNDFDIETRKPTPLGFYKYSKTNFANKDFLLNAIEWLTDDKGVMVARSKEVKLRLLDEQKVKEQQLQWQLLNMLLPIALVIVFGLGYSWWRKRRYGIAKG
jgi:ABC-2 type transport system permease protein